MRGANDINLRVTMDASQARTEAKRLHEQLARKFRAPTPADAWKKAWERTSGTPVNPINPNLPYEAPTHSGIWWANQRGIKGLGNEQYRHQFFTEREAKYMGIQFARAARKELVAGLKGFAATMGMYALNTGVEMYYGTQIAPGKNNRRHELNKATIGGGISGAGVGAGAVAGLLGIAAIAGAPFSGGASLALLGAAGAVGAGIGAAGGRHGQSIAHRNTDISHALSYETERNMRRWGRGIQYSDMALQKQLQLMPSRAGQMELIGRQIEQLRMGKGSFSIRNLEGLRKAMTEGGTWDGKKYSKGDIDTQKGQWVQSLLSTQYGRLEQLRSQKQMLKFSPHAGVQNAITDDYSRRGLFVGAQVDSVSINREIVADMRKIIKLLEAVRTSTGEQTRMRTFERGSQVQYDS